MYLVKRWSAVPKGQEGMVEAEEVGKAVDFSPSRAKESSYSSVVPAGEAKRLGHICHQLLERLHSAAV